MAEQTTVELWTAFGQPGAFEPRTNFAGSVPADHALSEPTRQEFGDGTVLLHAWGHGEAEAVAHWHEAVAAQGEDAQATG